MKRLEPDATRRSARYGLLLALIAVCVLTALPPATTYGVPTVRMPAATPAAGGTWLDRLNRWRASTNLPAVSENPVWSQGDYDHALYMVKNDLVTHYETPGVPYYTTAGDLAAQNSNIEVNSTTSFTDEQAVDWWMAAPFHAMGMMDPRLGQVGFGAYREVKSGWQAGFALDDIRGNSFTGGSYPVYFPGNGTTEPLTTYGGGEFPNPLQACPGYSAPTGLPVFVEVGGNVKTVAGAVHSFTGNGVALNHCVIDATNASLAPYLTSRGGVIVVPQQPLQNGVHYTVSLTVNGTPYTWSFTVGAFIGCYGASLAATPAATAAVGSMVSVTASSAGCANPQYQFWTLAPGASSWTIVQPYSATATFTWDTHGKAAGSYYIAVWARDAASAGTQSNAFGSWDSFRSIPYTLATTAVCAGVNLSTTPVSVAVVGGLVNVSATALGCASPLYQFWTQAPGGTYQVAQPYSTSGTFSWDTHGKVAGSYYIAVWARDAASAGTQSNALGAWDVSRSLPYTLTATSVCSAVTLSAAPAAVADVGNVISVSAVAAGCSSPLYQFWTLSPGASAWKVGQSYSATSTFAWNTAGMQAGSYYIAVWARDSSSAGVSGNAFGRWDAFLSVPYTLRTPCTSVTLTASPASSIGLGGTPTFSAHATGCSGPQYQFWILAPGATSWQVVQPYSSSATFAWHTTGSVRGAYYVAVWARDSTSTGNSGNAFGRWDAFLSIPYSLT